MQKKMHKLFDQSIYREDNSLVMESTGISLFNHLNNSYMTSISDVIDFAEKTCDPADKFLCIGNKIVYFYNNLRVEVIESTFN
jgi:acyl-ACP thioesterase